MKQTPFQSESVRENDVKSGRLAQRRPLLIQTVMFRAVSRATESHQKAKNPSSSTSDLD